MIDCHGDDLAGAREFWSQAAGPARSCDPDEGGDRAATPCSARPPGGLHIEVQSVAHASRLHLDIEADDIEAEADRLEALGAKTHRQPDAVAGG